MKEFLRPQKAGHQKIEERPEFENIVLDRCPRENQAMICLYAFTRHRDLGLGILDDMPLVQNAIIEILLADDGSVVAANVVGRDDDVLRGNLRPEFLAFGGIADVD
jgi:hypothetical protein